MVVRSAVTPGRPYTEYALDLRRDFIHSCAYCTITEAEAQSINFTIDHYEPRSGRPDLTDEYGNLMYCCNWCNLYKGDRFPPPAARAAGHRFFRCDEELFDDHFELKGLNLGPKSNAGDYTIHAVALNRAQLRKLRELRQRLTACHAQVAQGIFALRNVRVDQLPPNIRARVLALIRTAQDTQSRLQHEIDEMLREHARSPFLDLRAESEEDRKKREEDLKTIQGLYAGNWRGRQQKSQK